MSAINRDTHGSSGEEWIGFDLDGTLAKYDGWKGVDHIGDPIPAMVLLVRVLHAQGHKVKILTARVAPRDDGGDPSVARKAVEKWCEKHLGFTPEVTYAKDASMTALFDDRATSVEQNTGKVLGGWPDFLPKASDKTVKALVRMASKMKEGRKSSEKSAEERKPVRPRTAELRRMYDLIQADAMLFKRLSGAGFNGEKALRRAVAKLKALELARVMEDARITRNRVVHVPGYRPAEDAINRAADEYAAANKYLSGLLGEKVA